MMSKRLLGAFVMTFALAGLKACSASDSSADPGTPTGVGGGQVGNCVPNEQVSCACVDNTSGIQVCLSDGMSYSQCDCGGTGGSGGHDPCGDAFCDSTESCRTCQDDCGLCAPCEIAPKCEGAMIAPTDLAHAVDLDIPAMELVPNERIEAWLAEHVVRGTPAMRVIAAALDSTPAPGELPYVAHVRKAFRDNPEATARVRASLARAGLGSPADYRLRFPVRDLTDPLGEQSSSFSTMAGEFPGGTVECGAPMLRVGMFRIVVHESSDPWPASADEIYCLIEAESENGYEVRVTPLVEGLDSGDEHVYSNEAGVFWGTEGPKTPGDDLLITYNCIENDDSATYQALVDSIGDGAGQVGDVYDGSYGWVFPTIDGVAGVVSSAMAANSDDKLFNAQQQIPLEMQLELTNGGYWSVRRSDGWDWELFIRAWGCAEFGQL